MNTAWLYLAGFLGGGAAALAGMLWGRRIERKHAREVWRARDGVAPYDKPTGGKPKPGEVEEIK